MPVTFNTSKTFTENPSKRYIGVEIEVAYMGVGKRMALERVVNEYHGVWSGDGSIGRNTSGNDPKGTELIRAEIKTAPTNGDLFIKQMLDYGKGFRESKSYTNRTCGLHVHVDARDLDDDALDRVLLLWSKIEDSMYSLISPKRNNGSWCKPWAFQQDIEKIRAKFGGGAQAQAEYIRYCSCNVCRAIVSGEVKAERTKPFKLMTEIRGRRVNLERYHSLNLVALGVHGTLENRMHHGTTNVMNIIPWALLTAAIIDYAKANTITHINELAKDFNTLMQIAPNNDVRAWMVDRKKYWAENPNGIKTRKVA